MERECLDRLVKVRPRLQFLLDLIDITLYEIVICAKFFVCCETADLYQMLFSRMHSVSDELHIRYMFCKHSCRRSNHLWTASQYRVLLIFGSADIERASSLSYCGKHITRRSGPRWDSINAMPSVVSSRKSAACYPRSTLVVLGERYYAVKLTEDIIVKVKDLGDHSLSRRTREAGSCCLVSEDGEICLIEDDQCWQEDCENTETHVGKSFDVCDVALFCSDEFFQLFAPLL